MDIYGFLQSVPTRKERNLEYAHDSSSTSGKIEPPRRQEVGETTGLVRDQRDLVTPIRKRRRKREMDSRKSKDFKKLSYERSYSYSISKKLWSFET